MPRAVSGADDRCMFWPAAALAGIFLGFAIFYGSIVQSRLQAYRGSTDADETTG